MSDKKYILITPARNEEAHMERCIRSVIAQSIRPAEWIIVNDRSTDDTERIIAPFLSEYPFIKLINIRSSESEKGRDFGSKVWAFNAGYRTVSAKGYDFIGNLDADVTLKVDYFEELLKRFEGRPGLGVGGGVILELIGDSYRKQLSSKNSVAGAVQLFRTKCFEDIGGYRPIKSGGVDAAAEIMARMKGWEAESFEELEVLHHRRVSGSTGTLKARFRSGMMRYQLGYDPLFQLLSFFYRLGDPPYIIGSLAVMLGFTWAMCRRLERPVGREFVEYLMAEQRRTLKGRLHLKLT